MCTDHRLRTVDDRLLRDRIDVALQVLTPFPDELLVGQADHNLLRSGCLMDADGFSRSVPEVLLVGFIGELIDGQRVTRLVQSDLSVPFVSEEPDEGADVRNLRHHLLMLATADPGNYRGHESRTEGWNFHVEAKAITRVGELFTVGGHRRAPPSFLLLLVNAIHGAARLHAKELADIRTSDAAPKQ